MRTYSIAEGTLRCGDYMGRKFKTKGIYVYTWLIHFAVSKN